MFVIAAETGLVRQVVHGRANLAFEPFEKARNLLLLLTIHGDHLLGEVSEQIVDDMAVLRLLSQLMLDMRENTSRVGFRQEPLIEPFGGMAFPSALGVVRSVNNTANWHLIEVANRACVITTLFDGADAAQVELEKFGIEQSC